VLSKNIEGILSHFIHILGAVKTKNNNKKSTLAAYFQTFGSVDNSTAMWISMWISGKNGHIYAKLRHIGYVDKAINRLVYI